MRRQLTRALIWVSVLAWGTLVGAKLFDLVVLAGAWSASPPDSLALLPYGIHWPVDTGEFFIPSSATLLLATSGAVLAGWHTPMRYWIFLLVSLATILATLLLTVTLFWPRNAALWAVSQHTLTLTPEEVRFMVREWIILDWLRVAAGGIGFLAAVKAISIPYPSDTVAQRTPTPTEKLFWIAAGILLLSFVIYFLSGI